MAQHFEIIIKVAYDDAAPVPDESELQDNVHRCIERSNLLSDVNEESIVEEWHVDVEDVTAV